MDGCIVCVYNSTRTSIDLSVYLSICVNTCICNVMYVCMYMGPEFWRLQVLWGIGHLWLHAGTAILCLQETLGFTGTFAFIHKHSFLGFRV